MTPAVTAYDLPRCRDLRSLKMPRGNRVLSVHQRVKTCFSCFFSLVFGVLVIPSLAPLRKRVTKASTASKNQPGIRHSELLSAPMTLQKAEFWPLPRIKRKLRMGSVLSHPLHGCAGRAGGSSLCFERSRTGGRVWSTLELWGCQAWASLR